MMASISSVGTLAIALSLETGNVDYTTAGQYFRRHVCCKLKYVLAPTELSENFNFATR